MTDAATDTTTSGADLDAGDPARVWWTQIRPQILTQSAALPLPGQGQTADRWTALREAGRSDLVFAKLLESHADAVAILAEAGRRVDDDVVYGVWASASGGTGLRGRRRDGGWQVDGRIRFASGADLVDRALVVVTTDDGPLLCDIDVRADPLVVDPESWPALGMSASNSYDVAVHELAIEPHQVVGASGWYTDRPGFWMGAVGVAAVWCGGVAGLLDDLVTERHADPSPHTHTAVGDVCSRLLGADCVVRHAAERIDAGERFLRPLALAVRACVEQCAVHALTAVDRALGPVPLCKDPAHAKRVADLSVYIRQCHGDRDLARLGAHIVDGQLPW